MANTKAVAVIFAMLMTLTAFASVEMTRNTTESKNLAPAGSKYVSPAAVDLGTAGNFTILSKTGISTTGVTHVTGDIGVSPAAATYITGFGLVMAGNHSTSSLVTGNVYAANYPVPTPAKMTTAITDMEAAYTNAAGRTTPNATELYTGGISGHTIEPGLYKWSTNVWINATGVTLNGSASDIIIFQIAQNLIVANGAQVTLTGGLLASNIFWQVGLQATLGTTAVMKGNILASTAIIMNTGSTLQGRALSQTAVTLDGSIVTEPATAPPVVHVVAGGLQAAINASTSGDFLYIANGTNNVTDAQAGYIYVNRSLTFVGNGSAAFNMTGITVIFNETSMIHNLAFIGGQYYVNASKTLNVENCSSTVGVPGDAVITLNAGATINYFNSTMYVPTTGYGIVGLTENYNTVNVVGSHFTGNGTRLVYTGHGNMNITNTTFVGASAEYAVFMIDDNSNMVLNNVSIPAMAVGMSGLHCNFTVSNSTIYDVYVVDANTTIRNTVIDPLLIGAGNVTLVNDTFNSSTASYGLSLGAGVQNISITNCTFNAVNDSVCLNSDSTHSMYVNSSTFNLVNNSTAITITAEMNLYVSNVTWNLGASNSTRVNVTGTAVSVAYYGDSPADFARVVVTPATGSDITFYLDFTVQVAGGVLVYVNSSLTANVVNDTCDSFGFANFTDVEYGMVNEAGYINVSYIFMFSAPTNIGDVLSVTITDLYTDALVPVWLNAGNRQVMWIETASDYQALWTGYTVTVALPLGVNTFCYPLTDSVLASEFLALHPGIVWISQYNDTSSSFETFYLGGNGIDFTMVFGAGYILGCPSASNLTYSHSELYVGGSYPIINGSSFHGNPYSVSYTIGDFFANPHVSWVGLRTGDRYTYYYSINDMSTVVSPLAVAYIGSDDASVLVLGTM